MLFQPSNILPDVINGAGNGTIDVADGLTVSWQINGNSLMTAYDIYIYQNNTSSTQLYHLGKVSSASNLPASGVDYQGNVQRFVANKITSTALSNAGITNGNEYKLKIVQYYSSGGSETSVEQRSMSVFYTRSAPTLSISSISDDTLATRETSFYGIFAQAQGDGLTWARWQLYNNTGESDLSSTYENNLLHDTGKLYGVTTLRFDYDAFLNNSNYNVVLSIETENGVQKTVSYQFSTSWQTVALNNETSVSTGGWKVAIAEHSYGYTGAVFDAPTGCNSNPDAYIMYRIQALSNPSERVCLMIFHDVNSDFMMEYNNGYINKIPLHGSDVSVFYRNGKIFFEDDNGMQLAENGSKYELLCIYGGDGNIAFKEKTVSLQSNATSIQFTAVENPAFYAIALNTSIAVNSTRRIHTVVKSKDNDGELIRLGMNAYTNNIGYYTNFNDSFSSGSLTVTSPGSGTAGYFTSGSYTLYYVSEEDLYGKSTDVSIPVSASRLNKQTTAVQVKWQTQYIGGTAMGDVKLENGVASLENGASITWDNANELPLDLETPWAFIMKTTLKKGDVPTIFQLLNSSGGTIASASYTLASRSFSGYAPNAYISDLFPIAYDATITMMIIPYDNTTSSSPLFIVRIESPSGALVPRTNLYPSNSLYPSDPTGKTVVTDGTELVGFTQADIAKIVIGGKQDVDYVQIIGNTNMTSYTIEKLYNDVIMTPNYDPSTDTFAGTVFLAMLDDSLSAGAFTIGGTNLTGWAIYRESKQENMALHLADLSIGKNMFYDFGCAGAGNDYRYAIYPIGDQKYVTDGLFTEWLHPCYENWSIVEAELTENGYYKVLKEFVFGKNFSSGSISNNNTPSVYKNFTRYATVQMDSANYQSGTLSGLIGYIGYYSYMVQQGDVLDEIAERFHTTPGQILIDNPNLYTPEALAVGTIIKVFFPQIVEYRDDKKLRDDIWALSTSKNYLFLKSRKGDVIEIKIAGEITMETLDASPAQPLSASVPWVQIGDASKEGIIGGIG